MKTKYILFFLFVFSSLSDALATDYPKHFYPIAQQAGIDSLTSINSNDNTIFILARTVNNSGKRQAFLRIYDGNTWTSSDTFQFQGTLSGAFFHKNKFYISALLSSVNSIQAPSGKRFSLLQLKNNVWDTISSAMLDDSLTINASYSNDIGIYQVHESSKSLFKLFTYKINQGYDQMIPITTNLTSYGRLTIDARGNKLLCYAGLGGTVLKVDGKSVGGFFLMTNDVVTTPSLGPSGDLIGASITSEGDIIYFRKYGSLMRIWNGSSDKDIEYNLGSKTFGGFSPFYTDEAIYMPGILNGIDNTILVLDKDSVEWKDIHAGKFSFGFVYSKALGPHIYNSKTGDLYNLTPGGYMNGKLFFDIDSSCKYNSNRIGMPQQIIRFSGTNGDIFTMTDSFGKYRLNWLPGIIEAQDISKSVHISPCTAPSDTLIAGAEKTLHIPFHHEDPYDLNGRLTGGSASRPGEKTRLTGVVKNRGVKTRNAHLRIRIPTETKYISSNPRNGEWTIY
ncbi:MAG: hypothetical protein R2852_00855 [Bacteroidia bacterium]